MEYFTYEDNEFPKQGFTHTRIIVRAFLFIDNGRIAIHRLFRDDAFGRQGYYETPGGGVKEGESLEEALRREIREETGFDIVFAREIAVVNDAYNLIKRRNENHYFIARAGEKIGDPHMFSRGDSLIQETLYVTVDEAIALYEKMSQRLVSGLVRQRELPLLGKIGKNSF